jgi:hypothetical protein
MSRGRWKGWAWKEKLILFQTTVTLKDRGGLIFMHIILNSSSYNAAELLHTEDTKFENIWNFELANTNKINF